ncbi:hypothetical protein ABZ921_35800 [Streptomyces atriruber]|uniref:Uncharacterized protein n=1 Tax=Streptomyces atriruber TaxID=545121 RepID=A0ABV3BYC2_9ACTN
MSSMVLARALVFVVWVAVLVAVNLLFAPPLWADLGFTAFSAAVASYWWGRLGGTP